MPRQALVPTPDDPSDCVMLDGLKAQIRTAQVRAALAVNQELILLYWHIGREILARQQEHRNFRVKCAR